MRVLRDDPGVVLHIEHELGELAAGLAAIRLHVAVLFAELGCGAVYGHADDLAARDRAHGTGGVLDALAGVAHPGEVLKRNDAEVRVEVLLGHAQVRAAGRHGARVVRQDVHEFLGILVEHGAEVVRGANAAGSGELCLELDGALGSLDRVDDGVVGGHAVCAVDDVVVGVQVHLRVVLARDREVEVPAVEALEAAFDQSVVRLVGRRNGARHADEVRQEVVLVGLVEQDHAVVLGDEQVGPCHVDGVEHRADVERIPFDRFDGGELGREGQALVGAGAGDPLALAVEHLALVRVGLHEAARDVAVGDGEEVVLVDVGAEDFLVPDRLGLVDRLRSGEVGLAAGVRAGLGGVAELADLAVVLLLVEDAPCDRLVLAAGEHAAREADRLERAVGGSAPAVVAGGLRGARAGEAVQAAVVVVEDAVRHEDVVVGVRLLVVGDVDALAGEDADGVSGGQQTVVRQCRLVPNHRRDRLSHSCLLCRSLFSCRRVRRQ